jgi:hypothetical protein
VAIQPLNFRNPVVVRIAMLVALIATLLSMRFVPPLNWAAAGFFAVFFYKRKTGSLLNVGSGVRIGWLTGLLMFVLYSVLALTQLIPAALSGKLAGILQQQMQQLPQQDPLIRQQLLALFESGPGMAAVLIVTLGMLFVFITGLSIAGGALGAKMVGRD